VLTQLCSEYNSTAQQTQQQLKTSNTILLSLQKIFKEFLRGEPLDQSIAVDTYENVSKAVRDSSARPGMKQVRMTETGLEATKLAEADTDILPIIK
jgi:hypothetical protein